MLSTAAWLAGRAPRLVRVVVRAYQWTGDTHYSVLGVKQDASPREIKVAYLALSKQLHPDMNQNIEDSARSLAVHQNYVRVTQAYSVLGNRRDRAVYDLQLEGRREGEAGYTPSTTGASTTTRDNARNMTFEERARHMGFQPQVPAPVLSVYDLTCKLFRTLIIIRSMGTTTGRWWWPVWCGSSWASPCRASSS